MGKLGAIFGALKGGAGKAGAAMAPIAKSVAPGLAGAAGGIGSVAGAGATVVQGAAFAAGGTAVRETVGAVKTPSVILIVLGVLHYVLQIQGNTGISWITALILFAIAGWAVADKVEVDRWGIFVPMILFVVWYFFFGATKGDLAFWLYFGGISFVLFALPAIFTKGESAKPEIMGILPVLFLFLDLGLIAFVQQEFHLTVTKLMSNLILYMPWWSLLGVLTLPIKKDEAGGTIISLLKVGGIIYIIMIVLLSSVPAVAYESDAAISLDKFQDAQEKLRKDLPNTENPAVSNLKCLSAGRFSDLQNCINERQDASKIKATCIASGFKEGTTTYTQCVKEQQEIKEKGSLVAGIDDPNIDKPTNAQFAVSKNFPNKKTHTTGLDLRYPVVLKIENPRLQNFTVKVGCNFTNLKKKESFLGEIVGNSEIKVNDPKEEFTVRCSSPDNQVLNGTYQITYSAEFLNINSASHVERVFVGDKDFAWKDEWYPKILKAHFTQGAESMGARDFARINFDYGNVEKNPIIEKDWQTAYINLENLAGGKITKVHSYKIKGFEGLGYPSEFLNCIQGNSVTLSLAKYSKMIYIDNCDTEYLPDKWANPNGEKDYEGPEVFEAEVVYDYLVELKKEITVNLRKT
jgi:hypothetical protein